MRNGSLASESLPNPTVTIVIGGLIGGVVALIFATFKPVWVFLILATFAGLLPALVVKDAKLYWLASFLFALQLDVKKYLLDGLAVLEALKIDYLQFVFLPEIRLSDLPMFVLLAVWAWELAFGKSSFYFPRRAWLAAGFLGWAGLSVLRAPQPFLSVIEFLRQAKFFLIYLWAVNNIDSRRTLKRVVIVLMVILGLQSAVTLVRFKTQYFDDPFGEAFGRRNVLGSEQDELQAQQLVIDPTEQSVFSGLRGSYGTIAGGLTAKLFLVLLPFSIMLSFRNPVFSRPWLFLLLSAAGVLALFFTFSRTSIVAAPIMITACCWVAVRRGYLSRRAGLALFGAGVIAICAVTPALYIQINRKMENVEIRFEQYDIALAMIRSHPIFGVGLNNGTGVAREYARFSHSLVSPVNRATDQPIHSYYLTLMAEVGVVGLVLYLGFFFATWRDAVRLSSALRPDVKFYSATVALAFVGIAAGVIFNPLFEDALYTLLWLYAAMAAALTRINQTDAGYGETALPK